MPKPITRRTLLSRTVGATAILAPGAGVLSMVSCGTPETTPSSVAGEWIFVGPYTRGTSKGIYRLRFNADDGTLGEPELAAATPGPSFLVAHPSGAYLYAVNELSEFQGQPGGAVTAFAVNRDTGELSEINAVSSKGGGPCHLLLTPDGKVLIVANYGAGSTVSYTIGDNGALSEAVSVIQHSGSGPNERRQKAPHAHGIAIRPVGNTLLAHVADLGIDKVLHFEIGSDGSLKPWSVQEAVALAPGAGPRHVVTHPNAPLAFVINELDSTLTSFQIDADTGVWTEAATVSTLPASLEGDNTTAEVALHPNGRIVYGSNRGHDSIATFAVDTATGQMSVVGLTGTEGKQPRNFAVHPNGRFLIAANQSSGNLTVFSIDAATGLPSFTGNSVALDMPVCVLFMG
jgi:6-phosphogluconolactonase